MAAAIQRPLRGSRISTFYPVKNLPSLASLDSAFQLQEYISLLIRFDVHDVDRIVALPGSSSKDKGKEEHAGSSKDAEVAVDEACWIYEQLRRLAQDLSHPLITTLQQECTRASCPEMKAGEWLYLCVAHGNDGAMEQCCAIDYILHTVDSATALLNSPRTFPSRLQIPQTSHRHFASLARRLGRIFAHAYFHHREAFEQAEAESSLYARFLALTSKFELVPSEFLVIPSSHFSGEDSSDEDVPRGYTEGRQHYSLQLHDDDHRRFEQNQREASANASPPPEGGSGESLMGASKARITRPRTDTMRFTDMEASAVTDELALRRIEQEDEHEAPLTARPTLPSDQEAQFEAIPDPEQKTPEITSGGEASVPVPVTENRTAEPEKVEEVAPQPESEPAPREGLAEVPASTATIATDSKAEPESTTIPAILEPTPDVKESTLTETVPPPVEEPAAQSSTEPEASAVSATETERIPASDTTPASVEPVNGGDSILDVTPVPLEPLKEAEVGGEESSFAEAIKAGAELDAATASISSVDTEPSNTSGAGEETAATTASEEVVGEATAVVEELPKDATAES